MKKLNCFFIVVGLFILGSLQVEAAEVPEKNALTDQVIVKYSKQLTEESIHKFDIEKLDTEELKLATVDIPENVAMNDFIKQLEALPGIELVEPDYKLSTMSISNDTNISKQYHHNLIRTPSAWRKTKGIPSVKVAVLDNGFDLNHPDLKNQIDEYYSVTDDGFSNGKHGTHVAGIIGAELNNKKFGAGVAPGTSLAVIDVFEGGGAYTSDVIDGIFTAVEIGADIINMSFGADEYSYNLDLVVQYAHSEGIVIVAAAGNEDTDEERYPAALDNVIAVGATDRYNTITDFTNYGEWIDVVAPGKGIYSTVPSNGFESLGGTSMASPVVAGVAALIKSNEPYLSNVLIEERIFKTAIDDADQDGFDYLYGYGIVNAYAALDERKTPLPVPIGRISGASRYATAVEISKKGWNQAENVVLATGRSFPDALAGGPLAYQLDAPILLTESSVLNADTKKEIQRLGAETVYILGGTGAVSKAIEDKLTDDGYSVIRIDGKTRFETAAKIATYLPSTEAIIANGYSFPDVLSISSYASRHGIPILLTRQNELPQETQTALATIDWSYVIGGTGAVSDRILNELPSAERFGGSDRFATAAVVNYEFWMGTEMAYVSTGMNFPDALAGSVLAAKQDAPVLLVRKDSIPSETKNLIYDYEKFSLIGGTGSVSDRVLREISHTIAY
ncbi:cell wall-binding repeat-containing protein [Chryseomicrobium palamuruense]